jgi:deoxyribodipyrimidine photo-lyase
LKISVFWFRRDLRLSDNAGLFHALKSGNPVLPVFIFDTDILDKLDNKKDARVEFIHKSLMDMQNDLIKNGSSLLILKGKPLDVFNRLVNEYDIESVYTNNDYEPYALKRDKIIGDSLASNGINFYSFKDQVIFEKDEVVKSDGKPYTVFTPYSKAWLNKLSKYPLQKFNSEKYFENFYKTPHSELPSLKDIGFMETGIEFPQRLIKKSILKTYEKNRDFPAVEGTSKLSVHLRFGTVSPRLLVTEAVKINETWLKELIWREFFMMILFHFPNTAEKSFRPEYDLIQWRNSETEFNAWCEGKTGYPIVDAGMRELNSTGYMHNRVRMITASFLTKHLLIDWRWGERYFADKLLDYEMSSNVGNWQWAAGTGCDAAPYFRVFNPLLQAEKFDPKLEYIKKWVLEINTSSYPEPIVEHKFARERAIKTYKAALSKTLHK